MNWNPKRGSTHTENRSAVELEDVAVNYDESKANPFPDLPEVLTLNNGKKVTAAETWWQQRRPEIVEDFEREVVR